MNHKIANLLDLSESLRDLNNVDVKKTVFRATCKLNNEKDTSKNDQPPSASQKPNRKSQFNL